MAVKEELSNILPSKSEKVVWVCVGVSVLCQSDMAVVMGMGKVLLQFSTFTAFFQVRFCSNSNDAVNKIMNKNCEELVKVLTHSEIDG